jgi:hypothetical protein
VVKRIVLFLLQFVAFCALLIVGGDWDIVRLSLAIRRPALNIIPLWKFHITANYDYIANGLIFALALLLLILLLEALRKALRPWATISVVAFLAAWALSLVVKLGLVSIQP